MNSYHQKKLRKMLNQIVLRLERKGKEIAWFKKLH